MSTIAAERVIDAEQVGFSTTRSGRIDDVFAASIDRGVIAGAVTLVASRRVARSPFGTC